MVLERELQVVVPVGFLLTQPQDVTVCVDRPGEDPLPIRLRLIPARVREQAPAAVALDWPTRPGAPTDYDDGYADLGGGD